MLDTLHVSCPKAFLVLEEMKAAGMHPAIVRLNEVSIQRKSFFHLICRTLNCR